MTTCSTAGVPNMWLRGLRPVAVGLPPMVGRRRARPLRARQAQDIGGMADYGEAVQPPPALPSTTAARANVLVLGHHGEDRRCVAATC